MVSEKIELLGKGLYQDIPGELTLTSIPTASELDYVGAEDFDEVMLSKVLPQCIEENIDPRKLLEIDYQWVLRALRIINYGPYLPTSAIFCDSCGTTSRGEYLVDVRTVGCKPIPENFVNRIKISKDEFIDFDKDIEIHLLSIQEVMNAMKDKQFKDALGRTNRKFARTCYMIVSIGGQATDPVQTRITLQDKMSSADYIILTDKISELEDYGLRGGGSYTCPKCGSKDAAFVMFLDDRFFRPTMAALRKWRDDRAK